MKILTKPRQQAQKGPKPVSYAAAATPTKTEDIVFPNFEHGFEADANHVLINEHNV